MSTQSDEHDEIYKCLQTPYIGEARMLLDEHGKGEWYEFTEEGLWVEI